MSKIFFTKTGDDKDLQPGQQGSRRACSRGNVYLLQLKQIEQSEPLGLFY